MTESCILGSPRGKLRGEGVQHKGTASARALGPEWTWLLAGVLWAQGEGRGGVGPGCGHSVLGQTLEEHEVGPGVHARRVCLPLQALTSETGRRAGGVAGKARAPHRKCGPPSCSELRGPCGAAAPAPSNEPGCAGPGRPWRQAAASSACAPGPRRTCPQIRFLLSHYHRNRSFRPHSSPRYYLTRIIN